MIWIENLTLDVGVLCQGMKTRVTQKVSQYFLDECYGDGCGNYDRVTRTFWVHIGFWIPIVRCINDFKIGGTLIGLCALGQEYTYDQEFSNFWQLRD